MKIVINDTHCIHEELGTLGGDILIHCGDIENLFKRGNQAVQRVESWVGLQDFEHIFCTGGNYDSTVERHIHARKTRVFRNAIFMNETELSISGIKIFGALWVPCLDGHAFLPVKMPIEKVCQRYLAMWTSRSRTHLRRVSLTYRAVD